MSISHSQVRGSTSQISAYARRSQDVTTAPARAQRTTRDTQIQARKTTSPLGGKKTRKDIQGRNRISTTIGDAIDAYLQDHMGGNHSHKTLEWHATALGRHAPSSAG